MKRTITFGSLAVAALLAVSFAVQAADDVKATAIVAVDSSRLGAELLEVAKLVQSGVDEGVILTFIEKNPLHRNPTADELVYLKGLGLSGKAMVALMSAAPRPVAAAVQAPAPAPVVQATPAPLQTTVVTPPVVYAPVTPPVYVERPYVEYDPYPRFSFGLNFGHIFGHGHYGGHHWGHHGGHYGGHHGHHGGHHRRH